MEQLINFNDLSPDEKLIFLTNSMENHRLVGWKLSYSELKAALTATNPQTVQNGEKIVTADINDMSLFDYLVDNHQDKATFLKNN